MPTTRKKVIKTVYKEENSEDEDAGDFVDSGSEAEISEHSSSDSEHSVDDDDVSSGQEFSTPQVKNKRLSKKSKPSVRPKFAKSIVSKINRQSSNLADSGDGDVAPVLFSVKDLTDADKLLPSVLNLSESDSSDDESPKPVTTKQVTSGINLNDDCNSDSENTAKTEYRDVWSQNLEPNSEEIAKKAFMDFEQHMKKVEETKTSILNYKSKTDNQVSDVNDLLALGEELPPEQSKPVKIKKSKRRKDENSDSDAMDDWEEVEENKIPQQGLQLIVDFPDAGYKKKKPVDVEMMMKRKINRVKKEYQVYMHKVHVLCWLGHGNYVSRVLNDQEVLAAALSLVPSKECYPGERVDMKYLEQITNWFKDKLKLNQDKNENKFKPKAPELKILLLGQIKSRSVTAKKFIVYIFVSMLRAIGLQCRIMFNFVTLPIKPPSTELCSLSTKPKEEKGKTSNTQKALKAKSKENKKTVNEKSLKKEIAQLDGTYDSDSSLSDIMQVDGSEDLEPGVKTRSTRSSKATKHKAESTQELINPDVSTQKRPRKSLSTKQIQSSDSPALKKDTKETRSTSKSQVEHKTNNKTRLSLSTSNREHKTTEGMKGMPRRSAKIPDIIITDFKSDSESNPTIKTEKTASKNSSRLSLKRNQTKTGSPTKDKKLLETKSRTKSAPESKNDKSKYFEESQTKSNSINIKKIQQIKDSVEDNKRISHRDLTTRSKAKKSVDVTGDLITIIKKGVREAKEKTKKKLVKAKLKEEVDEDSDYLPEVSPKRRPSEEDFKPNKISPKPSTSRKIDRRVLSTDDEAPNRNKMDVWCEVYVEELEQWIAVDIIKGQVHCTNEIYGRATHPVAYVVGWDNNNYLKDLTQRYVPHWNTVTRKQRADNVWWNKAVQPWLGPKTARDKEEDESLEKMQLEAPLPKSIAEYKNHPLYALARHLLKFEALYPADAAVLGYVRREPVYARACVHTCRSRDTWLKEAKVVRLGEKPYKVVKARPKWDRLSNKLITDKPLEVFGPWQVQDYEPPVAENGMVPRNAYGNVELFKDCMLPKGTVHLKLPGLNKVAKKLNIDCAPAMTGFDFNGGWSHPVYDGYVVCKEFEDIITEAWVEEQEDQERKERDKLDARVYGNWRRLIKGLLIRERIKSKYGFDDPSPMKDEKKGKGPRLVVKKK